MDQKHLDIVRNILKKYPYTFYAFGSRVKGTQKTFSDLDLCFMEPISSVILAHIREDFEESNLPFTVDLVDWNMCDEIFKSYIQSDLELISSAQQHNTG